MDGAYYRKFNDRSMNSSKYHKKDGTAVRAKLKNLAKKEAENEQTNSADPKTCGTCDGSGQIPCPDGFAICRECLGGSSRTLAIRKETVMCDKPANYRFTWPGKDESFICEDHVEKLKGIAVAIGLHLQIIPLTESELEKGLTCNQKDG